MTATRLPLSLYLKSRLIGTAAEPAAQRVRWALAALQRYKHPELWEMYLEEQRLPVILRRLLAADSWGVDVGGHIGSFLNMMVQLAPKGQHIVFEASPSKAAALAEHFPSAKVVPYAVAETEGVAFFHDDVERSGYSRIEKTGGTPERKISGYEVKTCRLDDILLDRKRIDLIKLDIEGGELAALRGAAETIRKFQPSLIFECGSEYALADFKISRRELYDYLTRDLGYRIYSFVDFLFDKGAMEFDEFRKCGLYPFRAINFVALPTAKSKSVPQD